MEGNALPPQNLNPIPNNTEKKEIKGLTLLKMGILEIAFVGVTLLLFFGILNYFNILSVSRAFPEQLGWLPRQKTQTNLQTNSALQSTPLPSPTVTTTNFQYDTKKAESLLTQYIKNNIKSEFLPSKIEVKQGLSMTGKQEDAKHQFGHIINTQDATISANFIYDENTNTPSDYGIFIKLSNSSRSTPTTSLSNSLLSSYFLNPYVVSSCQNKNAISFCENFQTTDEGKSGYGYGIILDPLTDENISIIFTCFMPKESKHFNLLTSCIASQ